MVKVKKILLFLSVIVGLLSMSCLFVQRNSASAATADGGDVSRVTVEDVSEVEPRLLTNLSISIKGNNGTIITTVRNDFTLFPSTVIVIVELYSSPTYYESYSNMTLVASNMTNDLDIYKSISAEASTNNQQMYWQGRMRYKIDNDAWKERNTGTYLYDANGTCLGIM